MVTVRKILVAFDFSPADSVIFKAATALANASRARIDALFVEDISLIRLAGLPFSMEYDRHSGMERPLNTADVHYMLHRKAQAIEKQMAEQMSGLNLVMNFEVVRGHYLPEVLQRRSDVVIMTPPAQKFGQRVREQRQSLKAREVQQTLSKTVLHPVYVYYSGSETSDRAIRLGSQLAGILHTDLVILLPKNEISKAAELKARFADIAPEGVMRLELVESCFGQCVARISQSGCALFVLPKAGILDNPAHKESVGAINCPLVIVE